MASSQEPIDVPRPKKSVTFGLIILAVFMPWLALYLDGASWQTVCINLIIWFFLPPIGTLGATIHAIVCLCRTDDHRKYSKPARRRLRYHNDYSAKATPTVLPATASSTSVSSSDIEKENPPVAAPPPKKEDEPFTDPVA